MRLGRSFYEQDVLIVAPDLIGKVLVLRHETISGFYTISEVEAYRGTEDQASHARFGRTTRNAVMFENGGLIYMYLIYGMYWMINIVTATEGVPQAVLIRGLSGINGPGKVTKTLSLDKSFYGEDLVTSDRIWIEDAGQKPAYICKPRYGIDYAGEPWKSNPWRYIMVQQPQIS
jgi:DNA-3-methyladenine glycosylase